MSDQEVIEIQLSENLQRSDTHPMEEALAIERLQSVYQNIDEIALRMGKSKAFVYKRLKLVSLINSIREMFLANKCTAQQAFDIASLSSDSQRDLYEEYCSDWQDDEDFELPDTAHILDRFRYDLTEASFDIKDKKLVPEMGACTSCPFNSATVSSLFPDQARESICSNKECYKRKCIASLMIKIQKFLRTINLKLCCFAEILKSTEDLIRLMPEAATMPHFNYYKVDTLNKPIPPVREDYINEVEESEDDEESFKDVIEEYENDLKSMSIPSNRGSTEKDYLSVKVISHSTVQS